MSNLTELLTTFVHTVALIMSLVLFVSLLARFGRKTYSHSIVMGVLFSFTLIVSMTDPIDLGTAGIHDLRGILIGTGVALLGPVVGLMTLATGMILRWNIGGFGMVAGLIAMVLAFAGGLLWRYTVRSSDKKMWVKSVLLGLMVSVHLLGLFLLPQDLWTKLFSTMAPFYVLANIAAALMINFLISGELSFLSEAESSRISANTDHLTGILNRRGLDFVYPKLAHQEGQPRGRALLYFDIDRFKDVNDGHGHATGDNVLKFVADQISASLRPHDVFARLGGDEFAVILNQIDLAEAKHIAERCRSVVADGGFTHNGEVLPVSISIGAIWMLHHTEIDEILDRADVALYDAKVAGRNQVVFASEPVRGQTLGQATPA